MEITPQQLDRAVGAVLASAAGDALGSQYEFGPSLADDVTPEFGIGCFGHDVGEWTDDTSMAMPILQVLADGRTLEDSAALDEIVTRWRDWSTTAKDVGTQTRSILSHLTETTADAALARSKAVHEATGRSAGNGSLMRTGPVALGYLDRSPEELVAAAGRVAQLTHWEDDNVDACAIWCLAIRHAILTGELDVRGQVALIPAERRERWTGLIDEALAPGIHPRDFQSGNGWVVRAFQAALAALAGRRRCRTHSSGPCGAAATPTPSRRSPGRSRARCMAAARCPLDWKRRLHGWPGIDADELTRLAGLAARHGHARTLGGAASDYSGPKILEGSASNSSTSSAPSSSRSS